MKIIILGAGQVGASLAHHLASEANDITVVDTSGEALYELKNRLDIRTVTGEGAHPDVLERAGAQDAELLIAVTNSDEINMVACQVAYTLFHTPTKIARVREVAYLNRPQLFAHESINVDVLISPEKLVTDHLERLIRHPGAMQVLDFAEGKVQMVALIAQAGTSMIGKEIRRLSTQIPGVQARVAALFRGGESIKPTSKTVVEVGDEIFFVAPPVSIKAITNELRGFDTPYKRVIIAGGGNIGMRLAEKLDRKYHVKVIEQDLQRCRHLASNLDHAIVLHGDAADQDLMNEENMEGTDVFVALTNDDEANILSAMLAKNLGARKVMSLVNRPSYSKLVENGIVDIAISPQQISLSGLLRHVRRGDIVAVHSLRRGAAEAIEAIAHGDENTSKVVGRKINELNLPEGTRIAALVRGDEVIIVQGDTKIQGEDHVILFVADKQRISEVEQLFSVGIIFL